MKPIDQEMKLQGKFVIAEPCHEDWNKMTPESQGRFCASCKKCVVDFTAMTPRQMKKVYDEQQGNVCGRVKASQLSKPAVRGALPRLSRKLRAFAFALLLAFGFAAAPQQAQAQKGEIMGKIAYEDNRSSVSGTVRWDDGTPASDIQVTLTENDHTQRVVSTDENGQFTIPYLQSGTYHVNVISQSHYRERQKVKIGYHENAVVNFTLRDAYIMGDAVFVEEPQEITVHCDGVPEEITIEPEEIIKMGEMAWEPDEETELVVEAVQPGTDEDQSLSPLHDGSTPESAILDFIVYPNPTSDEVTVEMNLSEGEAQARAFLFDLNGKLLWEGPMQSRLSLQMAHHPAGTYIFKVIGEAWVQEKRIVKQ